MPPAPRPTRGARPPRRSAAAARLAARPRDQPPSLPASPERAGPAARSAESTASSRGGSYSRRLAAAREGREMSKWDGDAGDAGDAGRIGRQEPGAERLASRTVFAGRRIEVRVDRLRLPNGA